MKNLIEDKYLEYEKELKININLSVEDVMFIKGKMEAYMNILQSLNQYNIITAPKIVKLSEIVSRLQERAGVEIYFNRERKAIGYGEPDEDWQQNTWQPFVIFGDTKIVRICIPMAEITKWLYTLWIAGTEIIDDLECD